MSDILLSIAVIACAALIWGGVRLIRAANDRGGLAAGNVTDGRRAVGARAIAL